MTPPLYEYGGAGTVITMALANGFPPETYIPLFQPLTGQYRVVALPPRPLWSPPPPPESLKTWEDKATDLLAAMDAHNLNNVIGVGHSMGGVATMIAAVRQPERFRGIILLDPTIFPRRILWTLKAMRTIGLEGRFPLVQKALQRRASFPNREAAFDYWRGKRLFNDWDDATLWHYVDGLTVPDGAGGVTLRWSPEWEARHYATIYTNSWQVVPQLEGRVPVLLIRATESNTFFERAAAVFRRKVPSVTYAEIERHGHLFPQSAPDETRAIMQDWLARLS